MSSIQPNSSPLLKVQSGLVVLAMIALLLAATNLRGGLVVFAPLVLEVRQALSLSASEFGLLTTLPLICFAVIFLLCHCDLAAKDFNRKWP